MHVWFLLLLGVGCAFSYAERRGKGDGRGDGPVTSRPSVRGLQRSVVERVMTPPAALAPSVGAVPLGVSAA